MSSDWNVEAAVALWYQSQEEEAEEQGEEMDDESPAAYPPPASADQTVGSTGGGRMLGGGPAPPQATSSSSSSQPSKRKTQGGMKTLQDLRKQPSGRHGHNHDDDDDDDDDHGQDMFAGGEKSGLAVQNPGQNPRDLMERLLQRAREYVPSDQISLRPSCVVSFRLRSSCFYPNTWHTHSGTVTHYVLAATTMNLTVHTLPVVESPLAAKALNLGSSKIPMRTTQARSRALTAPSISGATASASTTAHYTAVMTLKIKQSCSNSCEVAHPFTFSTSSMIRR